MLRIADEVKVVCALDEQCNPKYMGYVGVIQAISISDMWVVYFPELNSADGFWSEELTTNLYEPMQKYAFTFDE